VRGCVRVLLAAGGLRNTLPALANAGRNYLSSQLSAWRRAGSSSAYGIGLSSDGITLSEGSGEKPFFLLVKDVVSAAPAARHSVLGGLTPIRHAPGARTRPRGARVRPAVAELLYLAASVLHVTAVENNRHPSVYPPDTRLGQAGPVTRDLQERVFFGLFLGKTADKWCWRELSWTCLPPRGAALR